MKNENNNLKLKKFKTSHKHGIIKIIKEKPHNTFMNINQVKQTLFELWNDPKEPNLFLRFFGVLISNFPRVAAEKFHIQ
jgi:hypothetical protein